MAIDCKFVPYLTPKQIVFPFPATEKVTKFKLSPACCFPFLISSYSSSLPLRPTVISAYKKNVVESNYYEDTFTLTYLEVNFSIYIFIRIIIYFIYLFRGIAGCGKLEVSKFLLIQSWWVTWILEFLGYMMLPKNLSRISRYIY